MLKVAKFLEKTTKFGWVCLITSWRFQMWVKGGKEIIHAVICFSDILKIYVNWENTIYRSEPKINNADKKFFWKDPTVQFFNIYMQGSRLRRTWQYMSRLRCV